MTQFVALVLPVIVLAGCGARPDAEEENSTTREALVAGPMTLDVDAVLYPGDSRSNLGRMTLVYQGDGNLVLYDYSTPLWQTHTAGTSPGRTVMQGDGNLVVYDANGVPVWYSGTFWPGTTAWVNFDTDWQGVSTGTGNLALCDVVGNLVWASNGNPNACKFVSQAGSPPGGGGDPGRTCAASCSGCMPLDACLTKAQGHYDRCSDSGFTGTDGACWRYNPGFTSCETINPWSRKCSQCSIDCEGVCPASIPPLCTCESNGYVDNDGNQCCYMETQDPWC